MAVSVDTVYQRVLAFANKEQRGYITPQDFNLFASQAQIEIFEQYFYDLNKARKVQGNDTVIADIDDMIEGKLHIFEESPDALVVAGYANSLVAGKILPEEMYRVLFVQTKLNVGAVLAECEILNTRDFTNAKRSPLTKPSLSRPIANLQGRVLKCNTGASTDEPPYTLTYIRTPTKPNWTYVVINKQAMYNHNAGTVNFELHQSEEIQLVNKILKLAGIATQQHDIMKAGGAMENIVSTQQQKI